jgi:hypothetical protein
MQTDRAGADACRSFAAEWLARFERYDVQVLILDPDEDQALVALARSRPEWALDFQDQQGILFVRSDVLRA